MDWKTFFSEIINSIAWPFTIFSTVYLFRNEFSQILSRIKKLKHKDTEVEFREGIEQLEKVSGKLSPPSEKNPLRKQYETLISLAEISPRAAVIEAFRILELSISEAILASEGIEEAKSLSHVLLLRNKGDFLDEESDIQFNYLRKLRNTAVHLDDFDLEGMPIELYIDIALGLADKVSRKARKKNNK
ncbi:MAG: hypothetical protein HND56_12655 [Pseudomonadota bacterium]|jgi:hypothetical protein|nr:hypothetical protein [Pseudomonadota bacterium]QKK06478.1 MAG: hypothetical protein HND56_12655 [Pseudomonadota bacterium]